MLELYLRDLERELARRLPPEDVPGRLVEAEAHLRDGVAARAEFGMGIAEAEREAVEAFGAARLVARRLARQALARRDRWRLGWFGAWWASTAFMVLFASPSSAYDVTGIDYFSGFLVLASLVGLSVAAFAARRPATGRLVLLLPAMLVLLGLLYGATWARIEGSPYGPYRRAELDQVLADYRRLDHAWTAFRRGGIEALRVPGGYLALDGDRRDRHEVRADWFFEMDLRPTADREAARASWANAGDLKSLRTEVATLERNRHAPWITFADASIFSPESFLLPVGVDLVFGTLGALAFAARRRLGGWIA